MGIDKLAPDAIMRGDIDGDEKVTLKDTQQILKAALCITELGTGETSEGTDNEVPATQEPADGNAADKPAGKPADTAQPSAKADAGETEPAQTEKPAATAEPTQPQAPAQTEQPDKPQNPVHTHGWEPVYRTVHHDEVGHYETVVVKDAWDEETTVGIAICNGCGMEFSPVDYGSGDAAATAAGEHVGLADFFSDCDSYHVESRTISTTHHPAVTEQKYIVDKAAYDEQVIDHYECTCGAKK